MSEQDAPKEVEKEKPVCKICGLTYDQCPAQGNPFWTHD